MRELSVAEQRYQAVLALICDGLSISQDASKVGVSRQTPAKTGENEGARAAAAVSG
jgi:DNA invertase Pin-like site-specific DNA recombinase